MQSIENLRNKERTFYNKYQSIHSWINYHYGTAKNHKCSCGKNAYEWALKKGCDYDWDIKCFVAMCRSCHNKYDNKFVPTSYKGEKSHRSKLTEKQVIEIINRINKGEGNTEIAKDYKITHNTISNIRTKKQWTHLNKITIIKREDIGVTKRGNKWRSSISVKNKIIHLGTFSSKEDAISERRNAEIIYR